MSAPELKPRVVVPNTARRDALITAVLAVIVFAFVAYGIYTMATPHQSRNVLVGEVVAKKFTPQREEQISFSGRRITGTKEIAGEYVLSVQVESENRTYDVPVPQLTYDSKQTGDRLEFVRPPSEQR